MRECFRLSLRTVRGVWLLLWAREARWFRRFSRVLNCCCCSPPKERTTPLVPKPFIPLYRYIVQAIYIDPRGRQRSCMNSAHATAKVPGYAVIASASIDASDNAMLSAWPMISVIYYLSPSTPTGWSRRRPFLHRPTEAQALSLLFPMGSRISNSHGMHGAECPTRCDMPDIPMLRVLPSPSSLFPSLSLRI